MLTIVIPSYNHEKYIYECLSAASQVSVSGIKILVIDDGSTDNTSTVIKDFIGNNKDINIKLVEKKNSGLVSSLNLALELVDTEYIYICASDDVPVAAGVDECYQSLRRNKELEFCIGGAINFHEDSKVTTNTYRKEHEEFFSIDFSENEEALFLSYPAPLLLQSTVFRKSALESIGGWDPKLKWDDYPTFVKLLKKYSGKSERKFIFAPDIMVVRYRHHGANTYSNISNQFFMVQQAMNELASEKIRDKAIGMKAAYYLLVAMSKGDFKAVFSILKCCGLKELTGLPYYSLLIVLERIKK